MADTGSILLSAGMITADQLAAAREKTRQDGGTIAEYLVLSQAIEDEELTMFYRRQLMVPRVNPDQLAQIKDRLIRLVPEDMAAEFRVVPVSLDHDQNLTIAMSDPGHVAAVDELGFFTGSYIVRAVATQAQLAWCLAHYYSHLTPLGKTLLNEDQELPNVQTPNVVVQPESTQESTTPSEPEKSEAQAEAPLKPRSGEVIASGTDRDVSKRAPSVVIDQSALEELGTDSKPILLKRKEDDVVLLTDKKPSGRKKRPTTLPPEPPSSSPEKIEEEATSTFEDIQKASENLVHTLRELEGANTRDDIINTLIRHLKNDCERVAFFVIRSGNLQVFTSSEVPEPKGKDAKSATLSIETESTLQELIDTQLPLHGPLKDAPSRDFVGAIFGSDPSRRSVVVPIALKNKVVGLLYGDKERHPLETQHVATAARAAGLAFERLVRVKRESSTTQE